MKVARKVFILVLIVVFSAVFLMSCKPRIDTSKYVEKPNLYEVMKTYEMSDQKKSHFEAGFTITMFKPETKGSKKVVPITFGQMLVADRIQNGDKIYFDATLGAANVSDNFIQIMNEMINLMKAIPNSDISVNDDIIDYITRKTIFAARLGYDGIDTYNGKADYIKKTDSPDFVDDLGFPIWFATNEQSIQNLQLNNDFYGAISPKDYLMYSTMIDLSPAGGWVKADYADKFINETTGNYLYNIATKGENLKNFIFNGIEELNDFDQESYAEELLLYASILPTVKSWISTPDSSVEATVGKDNSLQSLSSSMRIDININVAEMWHVLGILSPENKSIFGFADFFLGKYFCSAAGELGTWTVRIDLTTNETFSYDAASIDLTSVDQDMFLSSTVNNTDRTVINIPLD